MARVTARASPQPAPAERLRISDLAPAPDRLGILQSAFKRNHALQCGFCTAGILMSLDCFLREHPRPDEESIRDLLCGHLCRCTGYTPIVRAAASKVGACASKEPWTKG